MTRKQNAYLHSYFGEVLMTTLAMGILAEIIETPGLPQEDIFNMFSVGKNEVIDALTILLNAEYIGWRIDKADTCYYPQIEGHRAHQATKIQNDNTDIPF